MDRRAPRLESTRLALRLSLFVTHENRKANRGRAFRVCRSIRQFVIIKGPSGSNSVVECDLAKVEVAGSNPVSRSRICYPRRVRGFLALLSRPAGVRDPQSADFALCGLKRRGRQVVRPRSAKPLSAVRFRPAPPKLFAFRLSSRTIVFDFTTHPCPALGRALDVSIPP